MPYFESLLLQAAGVTNADGLMRIDTTVTNTRISVSVVQRKMAIFARWFSVRSRLAMREEGNESAFAIGA